MTLTEAIDKPEYLAGMIHKNLAAFSYRVIQHAQAGESKPICTDTTLLTAFTLALFEAFGIPATSAINHPQHLAFMEAIERVGSELSPTGRIKLEEFQREPDFVN